MSTWVPGERDGRPLTQLDATERFAEDQPRVPSRRSEEIGQGDGHRYRHTMGIATELLTTSWEESADRLTRRCEGLTDDEYRWTPTADAWTVRPDPDRPGRWTYDYDFAPPPPAPITTIGWRLVHISADNEIYWEYAFGPRQRTFPDLAVPGTAAEALLVWHDSRRPITDWLRTATDADLAEPRPSHLGDSRTAGEVVRILLDEQVHHGAEIALLRDLYPHRSELHDR